MKLVHINKVGTSGDLFVVREFVSPTDPGYGGGIPANPNFPSNTLPSGPPPHLPVGHVLVLVRDPAGVWHYAAIEPGQTVPPPIPDNALPGGPPPTGPGSPNVPGMPLPGGPPTYPTGGPVPPMPTPVGASGPY